MRTEAARKLEPIILEAEKRTPWIDSIHAPYDDVANASIFASLFRGYVGSIPGASWMICDALRGKWFPDRDKNYTKALAQGVGLLRRAAVPSSDDTKVAHKFAGYSCSSYGIRAMLDLAAAHPDLIMDRMEFDADRDAVLDSMGNRIDLRTGNWRPAEPGDRFTRALNANYNPEATCPTFMRFLNQAMLNDESMVAFLQRWAGYSLTGRTSEQKIRIDVGPGCNGKGTYSHVLEFIGGEYAATADSDLFAPIRTRNPEYQIARLAGVRQLYVRETKDGAALDESMVKVVTGEDTLVGRNPYEQQFSFLPEFKANLETNHAPRIRGRGPAIWRRILRIPWDYTPPDSEKDPMLGEKLKAEAPGILAWMVVGAVEWYAEGIGLPRQVAEATAAYRDATDSLRDFLDQFVQSPSASASSGELYEKYRQWAARAGLNKPLTAPRFKESMQERGYEWKATRTGKVFMGISTYPAERDGYV